MQLTLPMERGKIMGNSFYCSTSRLLRAKSSGYFDKSPEEIFSRRIHDLMKPTGITLRECRDSEAHPNSYPIIIGLDVTGSMRRIPHSLIKEGLPKLMQGLIDKGVPDASVLFLAIGDHKYDRAPIQIGQFESGDEELDLWLTRAYLEGGGGNNGGESYSLAWEFALNRVKADSFEKRNTKGTLITIGDEPCHNSLPSQSLVEQYGKESVLGEGYSDVSTLLKETQNNWNVHHIDMSGASPDQSWRKLLSENCISLADANHVPEVIINTVFNDFTAKSKISETDDLGSFEVKSEDIPEML